MTLNDLQKRVSDHRLAAGLPEIGQDEMQAYELDARRALAEELEAFFSKEYTIALTSGVGTLYSLSGSINVDLLWHLPGRAVHADGTEISILPFGCSSRELTYPRFMGYYHAVVEANGTIATITVWQGDGATAASNGNVLIDFATVTSLANWPVLHEPILVQRVFELTIRGKQG